MQFMLGEKSEDECGPLNAGGDLREQLQPTGCRVFTSATSMPSDKARVDVGFDLKGAAQRVEIDPSPRLATSKKLGRDIPSCPPVGLRRPPWAALARRACSILLSTYFDYIGVTCPSARST
jgi:hypothetical protein